MLTDTLIATVLGLPLSVRLALAAAVEVLREVCRG
mgnify:CR=1 FL=1